MKRLILFLTIICFTISLNAQTVDEVIGKYLTAAGGKANLEAIKTFQYSETIGLNTPMGAMEISVQRIKERGKLMRMQSSNEIMGESFVLVTDTAGYVFIAPNPMFGMEGGLQKMKESELKPMADELDCSGYFNQLINYAAKGYTASVDGEEKTGGRPSHKLVLKREKNTLTFLVDKETGLINSMTAKGEAAAAFSGLSAMGMGNSGKASKAELTFTYSDYKEVNGIKIPGIVKMDTPLGVIETKISNIKVNEPIDAKWYLAQ